MGCGNSRCHNGWIWWSNSEYPCSACSQPVVEVAPKPTIAVQLELPLTAPAEEFDHTEPPAGSWAATARMMAGPNPSREEGEFWDRWKDEMKEASW